MFGNKSPDFKFSCGDEAEHTITGFKGVVVGRTQWITNCNTYLLKSRELKDGKPMDPEQFDEPQLTLVKAKVHEVNARAGGPTESVRREKGLTGATWYVKTRNK